jgi:hypothetical protein
VVRAKSDTIPLYQILRRQIMNNGINK